MIRFAHEMNLLAATGVPAWSGNTAERLRRRLAPHRLGLPPGGRRQRQVGLVAERRLRRLPVRPVLPRRRMGRLRRARRLQLGTPPTGEPWRASRRSSPPPTRRSPQLSTKPVIIAETSSSETGGDKADWIEEWLPQDDPAADPPGRGRDLVQRDQGGGLAGQLLPGVARRYREVVASSPLRRPDQAPPSRESAPSRRRPRSGSQGGASRASASGDRSAGLRRQGSDHLRLSHRASVRIAAAPPQAARRRRSSSAPNSTPATSACALSRLVGSVTSAAARYSVSVVAFSAGGDRSRPRHHGFRLVASAEPALLT